MEKIIAGCYFEGAVKNPTVLVDRIDRHLRALAVDFDTVVVTGISGATLGPLLTYAMGKNLLFVRKGESCHSCQQVAGSLGRRWIFLDDFTESGETLRRCMQRVREFASEESFSTEFVGVVLYGGDRLYGEHPEDWRAFKSAADVFERYSSMLEDEIARIKSANAAATIAVFFEVFQNVDLAANCKI